MRSALLPTLITAKIDGVFLFETECLVEVDYETDHGALDDWSITGLVFEKIENRWVGDVFKPVKLGQVPCPDDLYDALSRFIDLNAVKDALIQRLSADGELLSPDLALRSDYHASVL